MNENIDLTEILKDCPEGTKLYSPLFGDVELKEIDTSKVYSVNVKLASGLIESFTREGKLYDRDYYKDTECVLFPSKEQRDWNKFTAPWLKKERDTIDEIEPKFKAGDWLYANELNNYANLIKIVKIVDVFGKKRYKISRDYDFDLDLAEFDFIEKHYHLWTIQDAKDGDVLASHECYVIFKEIDGLNIKSYCTYHYLGKPGLYRDTVQNKNAFIPATKEQHDAMMKAMNDSGYKWNAKTKTLEELIKSKFDPNTLQPFDRVLVRDFYVSIWKCNLFSHIIKNVDYPYQCSNRNYLYCIPYNDDTKHLVGTKEEAPEYYRYWED